MATRDELEQALRKAHAAGNTAHAKRFADEIRSLEAQEQQPIGRPRDILGQPLKQMVSGIAGDFLGGAAGGARAIRGNLPAGQELKGDIQSATAYEPTTRIGGFGQQLIGGAMETIGDYAEEVPAYLAARGEEYFGDPALAEQTAQSVRDRGFLPTVANRLLDVGAIGPYGAAAIQMAPEIAGAATGAGYLGKRALSGRQQIADQLKDQQKAAAGKEVTIPGEEILEGMPPSELAKYKLTSAGTAVPDETYKPLVRKGFEPAALTEYKTSTGRTKNAMLKMAAIKRKGMQYTKYGRDNRPADIVGQELVPRINYIRSINKRSGQQVNRAANALKGKYVDFTGPFNDFVDTVEEMGVPLREAVQNPEFWQGSKAQVIKRVRTLYDGSDVDLMPKFQTPLTNVIYRAGTGQNPDAFDLHKMKKFIDANVTYGKAETGLLARVSNSLKGLRSGIDETLDSNFPIYKRANDTYSETISTLDNFQSVMPRSVDLNMKNLDKALGQELRKLESNYAVRNQLATSLDDIDRLSSKYGKTFDSDLSTLTTFMTDLDRMFGATGRTSLEGRMESVVERAMGPKSTKERVKEFVVKKLSPEDKDAFEYLERMLKESEWQ